MSLTSMRRAYRAWQAINNQWDAARQELNHHYLSLLHKAEACRLDSQGGLLHTAAHLLHHPLDFQTRQIQEGLTRAFIALGRSSWRRAPSRLHLDILRYADRIREACRRFHSLGARLRLSQEVLSILQQHENVPHRYFSHALVSPEAVWTSLLLRQRRCLASQINTYALAQTWEAKLVLGRNWVKLLGSCLSPQLFQELKKNFQALEDQTAAAPPADPWSDAAQTRLEHCFDLAHRLALESILPNPDSE